MKLFLKRNDDDGRATLGTLTLQKDQPGASPFPSMTLRTLEDTHRDDKVDGETRIPAGNYLVSLRNEGAMTKKYARRFPNLHVGMLWLRYVPGFSFVYIHIGNTHLDTAGCILVGAGEGANRGIHTINSSASAYEALYRRVLHAINRDEEVWIIIEDETVIPKAAPAPMPEHSLYKSRPVEHGLPVVPHTAEIYDDSGWNDPDIPFCKLILPPGDRTQQIIIQRVLDTLNDYGN